MKKPQSLFLSLLLTAVPLFWPATAAQAETPSTASAAPNLKPAEGDFKNWRLLSVSHRLENKTLRAILGNDNAIEAARAKKTLPWPDGSVLAKVVWKERQHPNWPQAMVPGEFAAAEAMVKDSKKYSETGGWGFGHWEGNNLVMYDKTKSATCFACHTPMKYNDYVYTFDALQ